MPAAMFRREEKPGSTFPLYDDNKYAKTPISTNNSRTRLRFRKRHVVLVLCLVAASYMFLKSPSTPGSSQTSPLSDSYAPAVNKDAVKGQDGRNNNNIVRPPPPPPQKQNVEAKDSRNTNGDKATDEVTAAAAAAKQQDKKKKKKKKAPPTLFEFDEKAYARDKARFPIKSKDTPAKEQPQQKAPVHQPPLVVVNEKDSSNKKHNWGMDGDNLSNSGADKNDSSDNYNAGGKGYKNVEHGSKSANTPLWESRKEKVKQAFVHSWNAYRRDAWGKDEYHPISKYGSNMIRKGQGFTIIDSLDTILLMGLETEYKEAKEWVEKELDFNQNDEVNLFETTIRVLGGLLSAYDQSGNEPVFLDKAVDLANRLMGAFETPSGIPFASVHLGESRGVPGHDHGVSSTSETTTLQLEFKYLSYLTGDDKYWKAAENVVLKVKEIESLDGLVPIYINPYTGAFQGGEIRLGSRGDSYYEYLIKQYLQTNKQEMVYKEMYDHAISGVKKHLLGRTIPHNLLFVGEISKYEPSVLSPKMDHLVCFLGGTMALASTEGRPLSENEYTSRENKISRSRFTQLQEEDFKIGEELTKSCYEMYDQTETGLAPEIVYWVQRQEQTRGKIPPQYTPGSDFYVNDRDSHNWLRPETVESLFYLWRSTGDEKYRHWGWNIFEAIEKYSKVSSGGYSSIHDVRRFDKVSFSDKMETYFLAETLKYFYLLFGSDDVLPLDKYVFNTEAHPFPIFTPPKEFLTRTGSEQDNTVIDKETEEGQDEEEKYKGHIEKEDNQDGVDDVDDEMEEEMRDGGIKIEDMEDDDVGADDSLSPESPKSPKSPKSVDSEDTEDPITEDDIDPDTEKDEVDQGFEDPAIENEEGELDEEVAEVEVEYEDNNGESGQEGEEEEEEEGEEGDDTEEGEEAEEGEGDDELDAGEEGEEEEDEESPDAEQDDQEEEEEDSEDQNDKRDLL
ncbi:mannosyl-oligosaccharide alpha-1,2-mannosidase [Entomortierella beljakovae]|nr:mannosyl-oligosaccharide alpha-1,2-mannosidase [Entomortierella beljakovae]